MEVTEPDSTGPVKALSSGCRPLPAPSHTPRTELAPGAGFHRNKSCVTSSAPWRSIIDEGARPRTLNWACQVQGRREDLQKVENRTGFGPHVSTESQGLSGLKSQIQAWAGNASPGTFLRVWSKNILEKSPEGEGGLLNMQIPRLHLS